MSDELPKLPKMDCLVSIEEGGHRVVCGYHGYTEAAMKDYARSAIASTREQVIEECALLCEQWGEARVPERGGAALRNVAVAIRALKSQPQEGK